MTLIELCRGRRLQAMRNSITRQWAIVISASPDIGFPYEETLIFARLPLDTELHLLSVPKYTAAYELLRLAQTVELESHALAGNVFRLNDAKVLPVRARWTGVGYEAGLGPTADCSGAAR
jgi:hypothetical protein